MQIESIVLYAEGFEPRELNFHLGALNIIPGNSSTGKSSLTNIIHYCLGSSELGVPIGPISQAVDWYAAIFQVDETRVFVARRADNLAADASDAMLLIQPEETPGYEDLQPNTSRADLRRYLGGLVGIEENDALAASGGKGARAGANIRHAITFCLQGQDEVANPYLLFHRQGGDWEAKAIKDSLPFFLGAYGLNDLRNRSRLSQVRKTLARKTRELEARSEEWDNLRSRSAALLAEAADAGLYEAQEHEDKPLIEVLGQVVDQPFVEPEPDDLGQAFATTQTARAEALEEVRRINEQLRAVQVFEDSTQAYITENVEQESRLASLGLLDELQGGTCVLCGTDLEDHGTQTAVHAELEAVAERLAAAEADLPRVELARRRLEEQREQEVMGVRSLEQDLASMADTQEAVARQRDRINLQSYVMGKATAFLEVASRAAPEETSELEVAIADLEREIERLGEELDPDALRSRLDSALTVVGRRITQLAEELALEHSEYGVRLDPNALTIVAETDEGRAALNKGQIGSGHNWVGYHLCTYFALQEYFIKNTRPVPRFVFIDQPSQAFYPQDPPPDADLSDLRDDDRTRTKNLFLLANTMVESLEGELQVIIVDHAEFADEWFQDAVVEVWRDGKALVPAEWLEG